MFKCLLAFTVQPHLLEHDGGHTTRLDNREASDR